MKPFFNYVSRRMPHFFNNVDVLEYVPHNKGKSIQHLFINSRYFVIDPTKNNLSKIEDNSFNVSMSIDYFQYSQNFLFEFEQLHRVSSKFVMFSCAAAGRTPDLTKGHYKNLTMSDFYNNIDIESMFDSYSFDTDHQYSDLYFWGVKRNGV